MVDRADVRRAYDDVAATYAAHRSENGRGTEILERFLDTLSDPTRVLDAGCGQGTPVLSRLSTATTAIGVDLSRVQLGLASDDVPDAPLVQGDMTALPFEAATFDAVVAYWSIIHVPMDDHQTVVDEFARVVRPRGRLLLCEGTSEWIGENPNWLDSGVKMEWNIAGAKATRDQLRNAGFSIVHSWGVPDTLEVDEDETDREVDDDFPWTFFSARLDA